MMSTTKRTFWALAIFYMLIAFEFFYMAGPFAIYFYSVYGPGLNFINNGLHTDAQGSTLSADGPECWVV